MPDAVVPTLAQVARLRRMVNEPNDSNGYTTVVLTEVITRYPLMDAQGYEIGDDDWDETSADLNAAASEIWTEKASLKVDNIDFSADGSSFKQQQQYTNAMKMARHYGARRSPSSIQLVVEPGPVVVEEV